MANGENDVEAGLPGSSAATRRHWSKSGGREVAMAARLIGYSIAPGMVATSFAKTKPAAWR